MEQNSELELMIYSHVMTPDILDKIYSFENAGGAED
jgi:hypothetical protein